MDSQASAPGCRVLAAVPESPRVVAIGKRLWCSMPEPIMIVQHFRWRVEDRITPEVPVKAIGLSSISRSADDHLDFTKACDMRISVTAPV